MKIFSICLLVGCGLFAGPSDKSASSEFGKTELKQPSDGASDQSTTLHLSWKAITEADSYQVQLSLKNDFSNLIVDSVVSNTSLEVSSLQNDQRYFWRVAAITENNKRAWSDVWAFYTITDGVAPPPVTSFVSAHDGDFIVDGKVFRFAGTNAYYLPTYDKVDVSVVSRAFNAFQNAKITVVRMWAFYNGPPQFSNDITFQSQPGVYNEGDLKHLDNVIAKGKEHGIRFILTLTNQWRDLGGIPQYNKWDGNAEGGLAHFISDPDTQKWFKDYINMLLNRVNTATGLAYKDEPAIFSWEIINEGRIEGSKNPDMLRDWYQNIAQYIKSIDPNHMVSTGEEGFEVDSPGDYSRSQYSNTYVINNSNGSSYILNTSIPEIDYGTAHWYPQGWGFGNNVSEDMLTAQHAWVRDHQKIAEDLGKPFVLGEYGINGYGNGLVRKVYGDLWDYAESIKMDGSLLWEFTADYVKCYEYGGNICWPGGRADQGLYNDFKTHISNISKNNE